MDPLQWMGAIRMRDQTANKNITIMDCGFKFLSRSSDLSLKRLMIFYFITDMYSSFLFHKMLTDWQDLCGLLWCFNLLLF